MGSALAWSNGHSDHRSEEYLVVQTCLTPLIIAVIVVAKKKKKE